MPLQATSGAASYDAFGGGVAAVPNYIEDVFSTYLYTGNGSTQTITNGIDLAGKGGLVWNQSRSNTYGGYIYDTARGTNNRLQPFSTNAQFTATQDVTAFNSNGFTMGTEVGINGGSGQTYASWTFRKAPKFFDVVTYTGNGTSGRQIAHNLGSTPGCIIVKSTSDATIWAGYHRSLGATKLIRLNTTDAATTNATMWNDTEPTSTVFTVGNAQGTNQSGSTYVAYLFAHNAGGFGLTGTDNVISCGSTDTTAGTATINLGYEPQWILWKANSSGYNWYMVDNMRGLVAPGATGKALYADSSSAEGDLPNPSINITSTGFTINNSWAGAVTGIYIAIRRGPMKVPTSGTSVFKPVARTGTSSVTNVTGVGFPPDLGIIDARTLGNYCVFSDKLRGSTLLLASQLTNNETYLPGTNEVTSFDQNGVTLGAGSGGDYTNTSPYTYINWFFQRAPSFFDEVCYTGTGTAQNITHNLGVAPELMIVKNRTGVSEWTTYQAPLGASQVMRLNSTIAAFTDASVWNGTSPTSSVFSVGTSARSNDAGSKFVIYLFATCAGVSKVFSYTGNGSSQTINCNFTGGARFVLIKRTDNTGDWYVWDSARGIVSGNDPHLSLNTTVAEVTTDDTIDTDSTGFVVNQVSATNVNVSSATYIGIAIA